MDYKPRRDRKDKGIKKVPWADQESQFNVSLRPIPGTEEELAIKVLTDLKKQGKLKEFFIAAALGRRPVTFVSPEELIANLERQLNIAAQLADQLSSLEIGAKPKRAPKKQIDTNWLANLGKGVREG